MHGVARERRRDAPEEAAALPGVAADEDLGHFRLAGAHAGDLEVVDVAAVAPLGVDELVIEHAEPEIELGRRSSLPPFVMIISGIAETAITRIKMK